MPLPRNRFEFEGWVLEPLVDYNSTGGFDCGMPDLNNFFQFDVTMSDRMKISKTFKMCPMPDEGDTETDPNKIPIVGLISFSNDAIEFDISKDLPYVPKLFRNEKLPAVKIRRLGIHSNFHNGDVGSHLLNLTKIMFCTDNRTGCRIITVDAYNNSDTIAFYDKNGFSFMTAQDMEADTRAMYFDLYTLDVCKPH